MSTTRSEAIKQVKGGPPEVSNQTSIVKRMVRKRLEPVKLVIPGGKQLMEQVDEKTLKKAIFTWLRYCNEYTEVTISLARDLSRYQIRAERIQDFNNPSKDTPWSTRAGGKSWLAEQLAQHLIEQDNVVALTAKADGIYAVRVKEPYTSTAEDWEPHLSFLPKNRPEYQV